MISEITIKYSDSNTLKVLKSLSKYLDFTISKADVKGKQEFIYINGVPTIPGDRSVDISDLSEIVSRNKMDAKKLRKEAWQRNK